MVIKAKKGFYDDLSRKELQNMCKLYGLPANKSHSELEKSLVAYLEEGVNSSICNLQKVSHSKCKGRGINHRNTQRKSSNEKTLSFSREDMVDFWPCTKHRDKDDGPSENTLAFPVESSTKVHPSPFEFYVRSEEGISLYVDLNSSPSDWTEKLKNEVHIFENVHCNKSRSLHEDLGCLKEGDRDTRNSYWSTSAEDIRDRHVETRSSPNSLIEKMDQSKLDPLEKGETSSIPLGSQEYSVSLDGSEKSNEDQPPKACILNSSSKEHIISVADSCAKAGCTMVCDSNVVDGNDDSKSVYDTTVNCISHPLDHVTFEHTTSNLSQCQNTIRQYDSSLPSPAVVDPGCSVSSSLEMQSSEVASCNKDTSYLNCENGGQMGGFDVKHNTGSDKANSSELKLDVCGNHLPVPAEEGVCQHFPYPSGEKFCACLERSNILNERESSECSQFTKESGKTCLNPDKSNSREGIQRKRKHVEIEHQSDYAKANIKILRSTKRITRKDFPRRSMRLLSK